MTDCILVDLDGTLANCDHRRDFVRSKPKNFKAFFEGMVHDTVNEPVRLIVDTLKEKGLHVVIMTGRDGNYEKHSRDWLKKHNIEYDAFFIRKVKDYRCDSIVKSEIVDEIIESGYNPVLAIDDRPRVLRMLRERGIFVFDVNQSGEEF